MRLFGGDPILAGFQQFTDERRDNVPAFLCSMWFCASFCCALMWRHALGDVLKHRLAKSEMLQPRLYWFCYFWALESVMGLVACRSMNYTAEELRGETTTDAVKLVVILTCLCREFFANAAMMCLMVPWRFKDYFSPKWIFIASCLCSGLFGRVFSIFTFVGFVMTIRSIVGNTKGYQGQEGIHMMFRAFMISSTLYGLVFISDNATLSVWFNLVCWCTLKVIVKSFWQLDSYYWDTHADQDHKFQNFLLSKISIK